MKEWYAKLPNQIKAGVSTAVIVFITAVGAQILGITAALHDYVTNGGQLDVDLEVRAILTAGIALVVGVVNTLIRYAQAKAGLGEGPQYPE